MSIKPVLFNTKMVRAILEGRKSCTRRIVKPQQLIGMLPDKCKNGAPEKFLKEKRLMFKPYCDMTDIELINTAYKAPYQPGDILYVRETWESFECWNCEGDERGNCPKADVKIGRDCMNQCSKKSMFRCRNCNHINCDMYTKIYAIFTTVVKCFILACGISLLLFFFYDNELEPTKDNIKCVVSIIYTNLLTAVVITYLFKKLIGSIKEDVVNAKPYGKAQIGNKEKTYENIREMITVHEAGHAVMSYLKNADTIIVNASLCEPNVVSGYDSVVNAEIVKSMILIKYAGAIAEELIFGHYSAGSFFGSNSDNSDFKRATELIKGYITMINPERSKTLLDDELKDQLIDISKAFYQECKELLSCNIKLVEHLSNVLTYKERLTTEEVLEIINAFKESKERNT